MSKEPRLIDQFYADMQERIVFGFTFFIFTYGVLNLILFLVHVLIQFLMPEMIEWFVFFVSIFTGVLVAVTQDTRPKSQEATE